MVRTIALLALTALAAHACVAAETRFPHVTHVGMVAPDVIGITVMNGRIEYGRQVPYRPRPGDEVDMDAHHRWVRRDGEPIGTVVGRDADMLWKADRLVTGDFDVEKAGQPDTWRVRPEDGEALTPEAVYRKSKPSDLGRTQPWPPEGPVRHVVYLKLPRPLETGRTYLIESNGLLPPQRFRWRPDELRSEAVHVNQVGFRPDDPVKTAFLSCWLGDGGGLDYSEGLEFRVVEAETGRTVHRGSTHLARAADRPEDPYDRNYNGTDVWRMDFAEVNEPGTYRVAVKGIGCSYPFRIAEDAWLDAFRVSARGFYHQRSGIALGPPYTDFERPRTFHPDDGFVVYHSTCPLMNSGNGLNALGTDEDNFGNLVAGKTDRVVADAWGGYMDAGDWDRRIQHLRVTRYLLDLVEMFPGAYADFDLNIPESDNDLPDLVDEGLFNLDCYRRMQTEEGGIRGGIESAEHPRNGEASWQESLTVMAYAPGIWSSWLYAGTAARAARVLQERAPGLSQTYRRSALRAAEWAEEHYPQWRGKDLPHAVNNARNYAAAELFRLTGEERWHRIFAETTALDVDEPALFEWRDHQQREAAWVYLNTDREGASERLREKCRQALIAEADERLQQGRRTAFGWTKHPWAPVAYGTLGAPDAVSLVRAHRVTGRAEYLRAALLACQYGAGANPVNICYTTGLGQKNPLHPLHIDSRITHQPPPPGLTVFGPHWTGGDTQEWAQRNVNRYCYPDLKVWPTTEAYWDVFHYPSICEFTVQNPMSDNAYAWGYLAAR